MTISMIIHVNTEVLTTGNTSVNTNVLVNIQKKWINSNKKLFNNVTV